MVLLPVFIRNADVYHLYLCKMKRPNPKAMILINKLMAEAHEDTKKAAWAFFNKCDLCDLQNTRLCLVDMERVDSFLSYAKSKGVNPNGGAFTENMKAQYFYI